MGKVSKEWHYAHALLICARAHLEYEGEQQVRILLSQQLKCSLADVSPRLHRGVHLSNGVAHAFAAKVGLTFNIVEKRAQKLAKKFYPKDSQYYRQ